jgi:hypothetical protein
MQQQQALQRLASLQEQEQQLACSFAGSCLLDDPVIMCSSPPSGSLPLASSYWAADEAQQLMDFRHQRQQEQEQERAEPIQVGLHGGRLAAVRGRPAYASCSVQVQAGNIWDEG